ncbi:inositol-3-phosphate synthase [Erythrobacter sp. BLCC-B19]|uniref:inositol-3-phosphate synthase n=1 Tax=Erythrobacter sp. BLCC-B19 TaxID=3025315 RepID=UPI00235DDB5F|nr:inositol-3-phosphate synthase [Erythrobacter sp. BLCC-B19]WDA41817.1 inositol-3-phosphate synthase [Erythrobacter sp. BLCC-B19]
MNTIRTAIVGLGNCASALVQGVEHYRNKSESAGRIFSRIAQYQVSDVQFVLGIDVDQRKIGRPLGEAIFAPPNNTSIFEGNIASPAAPVMMGRILDGVAPHMTAAGERGFQPAAVPEASAAEIIAALRRERVDVLVNFLPVGSQAASEFYMECALEAGVGVVNAIPVFIASDAGWEARFRQRGLPIVGDDIKAQIGATVIHRTLAALFAARGVEVAHTYQLNTGGNTDFLNMLDRERLADKKESKTEAVQAALAARLEDADIRIGPAEYVPWQKDNKICFLRMEGAGWGGVPMHIELRLSVEDSPNAAACVVDAIRFCKLARDRGEGGALIAESAFYCKHPPRQMAEDAALALLDARAVPQLDAAE